MPHAKPHANTPCQPPLGAPPPPVAVTWNSAAGPCASTLRPHTTTPRRPRGSQPASSTTSPSAEERERGAGCRNSVTAPAGASASAPTAPDWTKGSAAALSVATQRQEAS